jgi:hypothetical protein
MKYLEKRTMLTCFRSATDLVYEWTDLEVTFRVINKKGVNAEVAYPLFPPPEDISIVPW